MEHNAKLTEEQKQLVCKNMKMVYKIASMFGQKAETEELVSEGMLALSLAASRYDESKGKFSTYAYTCIKGTMQTYLNRNKLIRPGRKGNKYIQHEILSFDDDDLNLNLADEEVENPLRAKILSIIQEQVEPAKTILSLYYQGYTQVEIAKIVQKTQTTVSRTLLKIGDKYRKELEDEVRC